MVVSFYLKLREVEGRYGDFIWEFVGVYTTLNDAQRMVEPYDAYLTRRKWRHAHPNEWTWKIYKILKVGFTVPSVESHSLSESVDTFLRTLQTPTSSED